MSRQNAEINVTPLVDVVLVLLIIFMVVTPLLEKEIAVQVPATETVEDVSELPPDQLVVHLTDKGEVTLNSEHLEMEAFRERLQAVLEPRGDKTVFFQSDEGSSYGALVQLLDLARQAGATKLGMATEVPDEKK